MIIDNLWFRFRILYNNLSKQNTKWTQIITLFNNLAIQPDRIVVID